MLFFSRQQQGSVMVYMAAMTVVLAMMVLFVYNTGHIANEKTRLQNTTDAAAHSVALLQSRDLNFQAYMNRSMVANQVAVAQAVSLDSWTRFLDKAVQNLKKYTFWVPYWGAAITAAAKVSAVVKQGVDIGANKFVTVENILLGGLSNAQMAMHGAVIAQIPLTMKDMVKANDPGVSDGLITNSALLAQLLTSYNNALTQYKPNNVKNKNTANWKEDKARMDEFKDVTLRSRDGFSTNRTYTLAYDPIPSFLGHLAKMEKAGGTEMLGGNSNAPYYTWAAMDTLSLDTRRIKFTWTGPHLTSWKETVPLGWGAAQTGETISYSQYRGSNFGSTWNINKIASGLAYAQYQSASKVGSFSGLRPFNDITQKGLLDTMTPAVIILTKPQGGAIGVRTARDNGYAPAGTRIDIEKNGGMLNNQLHAVAKAEAYFSRPSDLWSRAQGGREYGNVYNPYWQPRLSALTTSERAAALLLAGIH